MSKLTLTFIFLFSISTNIFGCLNGETKILKNGIYIYEDDDDFIPNGHSFYVDNYSKLVLELENLYKKTKDLDYLSDVGYVMIIQKKYKEALEIYLKIEKIEPNRYSTASNIGTIYELLGENIEALKWIKKSIKINSKSHKESEWLHVKILEVKINKQENITSTSFLNTDFGTEIKPKSNFSKSEILKMIKAIYYQLNERVTFIKPKDYIIAKLLFELGNLLILNNNYEEAIENYKKAIEYGSSEKLVNLRIELCTENIKTNLSNQNIKLNDELLNEGTENIKLKKKLKTQENETDYFKNVTISIGIISLILMFLLIKQFMKK